MESTVAIRCFLTGNRFGVCGVENDFHDIIFTSFNMSKFMNLDARITIESVRSRKCDVKFNIISIIKNILFF